MKWCTYRALWVLHGWCFTSRTLHFFTDENRVFCLKIVFFNMTSCGFVFPVIVPMNLLIILCL